MTQQVTAGILSTKAKAACTFINFSVLLKYGMNSIRRLVYIPEGMMCMKGLWPDTFCEAGYRIHSLHESKDCLNFCSLKWQFKSLRKFKQPLHAWREHILHPADSWNVSDQRTFVHIILSVMESMEIKDIYIINMETTLFCTDTDKGSSSLCFSGQNVFCNLSTHGMPIDIIRLVL